MLKKIIKNYKKLVYITVRSGPRIRTERVYTVRFWVKGGPAHHWTGPRSGPGRIRV
jgi:hypothetical protein